MWQAGHLKTASSSNGNVVAGIIVLIVIGVSQRQQISAI
jgi:hypothetical protein